MTSRHVSAAMAVLLLAVTLGPLAACQTATQVFVELRLRDGSCSQVQSGSIAITRASDSESGLIGFPTSTCADGVIGSLTAVPDEGSDGGKIHIRALVGISTQVENCTLQNRYQGCIVARRRVTYRKHALTRIPIQIDRICENEACDMRTTCNQQRVCEDADVDASCAGESCDLVSETGGPGANTTRDAAAVTDAAGDGQASSRDGGGSDAASDGGTSGGNHAGPGVYCGTVQCPVGQVCSTSGTCAPSGLNALACDESTDCNMQNGERCCYNQAGGGSSCVSTSACSDDEMCWGSFSCTVGAQCLNTVYTTSFGPHGACRGTSGNGAVACRGFTSCATPLVCRLSPSGQHVCGSDSPAPRVTCETANDCSGAPCRLFDGGLARATRCAGSGFIEEVCDGGPGSCAGSKVCTLDTVEVQYGYFLRVCR